MRVVIGVFLVLVVVILLATINRRPHSKDEPAALKAAGTDTTPLIVSKTESIYRESYNIPSDDEDLLGMIRYHYDTNKGPHCDSMLILGVGTFMTVNDYDNLSRKIAASSSSIMVIVADHNVNNIIKTSPERYATLINALINQLDTVLPMCDHASQDKGPSELLFGGHSASGQAAVEAWQQGLLSIEGYKVAFVGLDPYDIADRTIDESIGLSIPSLSWGFTRTTCFVRTEKSAKAAYEITRDSRVLYVMDNAEKGSGVTHCAFTDRGCGFRSHLNGCTMPWQRVLYVSYSVYEVQHPSTMITSSFQRVYL